MKILIADDSELIRDSLANLISGIPAITIIGQAENTREAETYINRAAPEIVILDIRMPGGNGMGLLKKIKTQSPHTVVIMFTDYPYQLYRERSMELGADYFFEKSTEFEKLINTLKRLTKDDASE